MAIVSRYLTITQGNIDNSHMYLTEVMDMFPEDVLGGHDESQSAARSLRVWWGDEAVETDIVREKHIFWRRGWVRRFFDANRIAVGDLVRLDQIEPYVYRVSRAESAANKALQQTSHATDVPPDSDAAPA